MKKAVSIFLIITIAFNVLAFGVFNVNASAVLSEIIGVGILGFVGSFVIGGLSGLTAQAIADASPVISQNIIDKINDNAIQNGEMIEYYVSGDNHYFRPVSGLDSESEEFAEYLCDRLNNNDLSEVLYDGFQSEYGDSGQFNHGDVHAEVYADTKNAILNAFSDYINAKAAADSIGSVDGFVTLPFDFVGPVVPSMTMPTVNGVVNYNLEGFTLFPPHLYRYRSFSSEDEAKQYGATVVVRDGSYYKGWFDYNCYGYGYYYIYNNDLYYLLYSEFDNIGNYYIELASNHDANWSSSIKNKDGVSLSDAFEADGVTDYWGAWRSMYYGVYVCTTSDARDVGRPTVEVTADDFIVAELGETISFPLTNSEQAVADALALGLLSSNPELTVGADGTITAADGISLATLENLIAQISEGQLQFEDFEQYLQYISALLAAGNADRKTINSVINSLKALEQSQAADLSSINSAVLSISEALSIDAAEEAEIDLPDVDAEGFIISHSGLTEATAIANSIPIVSQVTQLLSNVFDSSKYSSDPPNFQFYWDSNGDGVQEVYNAFDLSFLETRLSNNNLVDKGRFNNSMTIRQFIQYIIIFLCYLAFAIKIIKKLPSLFGGSESSDEFRSSDK